MPYAFRTFADRETIDYSMVERSFSKTEMLKKSWEWKSKLLAGMKLRLDAAIDKLDNLSKDVDFNKMEKCENEKGNGNIISHGQIPMVAEKLEYQYGSEAFEVFRNQRGHHEVISQISEMVLKKDSTR